MYRVLFVCLGNICRSPTAEAVMTKFVQDAGYSQKIYIDSCGTSANHAGEASDHRMQEHAQRRGYQMDSVARGFRTADFEKFDYIITMDPSNFKNISTLDPEKRYANKLFPMIQFCKPTDHTEIPDPYYGGPEDFETVLDLLEVGCKNFMDVLKKDIFEEESRRI